MEYKLDKFFNYGNENHKDFIKAYINFFANGSYCRNIDELYDFILSKLTDDNKSKFSSTFQSEEKLVAAFCNYIKNPKYTDFNDYLKNYPV